MNIMKDFVKPTAVLTVICVAVSAALVYTQSLTAPIIAKAEKEAADKARTEVLEGADSFTKVELSEMPAGAVEAYKADNGAGFVITTAAKGYGSDPMNVMTGISADGIISKVKILSHNETPGVGTKATDSEFPSTFIGKNADLQGVEKVATATISSNAIISAVEVAFKTYTLASGGIVEEEEQGLTEKFMASNYPAGTEFTKLDLEYDAYKCGDNGYIVSGTASGYKDKITVAVLFNTQDEIINIAVTEIHDTPKLGTQVAEEEFISQFKGKKEPTGIDMAVGATISSEGFIKAVRQAIERLPEVKGAK